MSFGIHVEGGTGAGSRRVRTHPDWECDCPPGDHWMQSRYVHSILLGGAPFPGRRQPGHRYSCSDCGARRP